MRAGAFKLQKKKKKNRHNAYKIVFLVHYILHLLMTYDSYCMFKDHFYDKFTLLFKSSSARICSQSFFKW